MYNECNSLTTWHKISLVGMLFDSINQEPVCPTIYPSLEGELLDSDLSLVHSEMQIALSRI